MLSSSARRAAAALAASAALAAAIASPAAAAPRTVDVVNLGDSYSAAFGTGGVAPVSGLPDCYQGGGEDHVAKIDGRQRMNLLLNAACAGATTDDVQAIAAAPAVTAALGQAELVTMTLGGNDIGWGDYVGACSIPGETTMPGACDALLAQAPARIEAAAASAGETVAAVDAATDGEIVVLGYPRLFDGGQDTALLSADRVAQLNLWTDALNAALAEAAEANGAEFVDVSSRFAGHGADSADPWLYLNPADPRDWENLHPTEEGYLSGYYPALMSAISPGQLGR
ncbi:lipase 1 [Kocuria dechangensis]|uniref:Lipase 1 n=1 Tax=Kocuria dechangensis TaxID=1176249 RepID=A0A917H042_9MICC|nr:GDSL-type esterase/lipase family protein [Kocuria dechangensis]GGG63342.1 lipase 1 [Kocuria dechangensis]